MFWHGMNDALEGLADRADRRLQRQPGPGAGQLQNQTSYDATIDKYIQSSPDSRPDMVQFPEYALQTFAQSGTVIPLGACIEASGFDTSTFLDRALEAYTFEGVQWAMPFNV